MAISIVIPLASGVFDVSVGNIAGFGGVVSAWFMANSGMSPWLVIALTMLCTTAIGVVNAFVVVVLRVNALIGTLGTGAIILAATKWVSDEKIITERVTELSKAVARKQVWGITMPVFIMLGVMLVVAYALEQTTTGRAWYAVGFDATVAKLAGIRTKLLQFSAFMISGLISGLAGVIDHGPGELRLAGGRAAVPPAGVRRGLPRGHAVPARSLQRVGRGRGGAAARHR